MLALLFFSTLLMSFVIGLFALRPGSSEKAVARHIQVIRDSQHDSNEPAFLLEPGAKPNSLSSWLNATMERSHFAVDIQLLLTHAGSEASVSSVVFTSVLAAVACGLLAQVTLGVLSLDLIALVAGACSRWGLLRWQGSRRLGKFNAALADAIELTARALRAGHSMSSAIEIVAEQSAEPLASEFARVFQQQKFGIPFRQALLELGSRVPSKDLQFLITAILVQKETGGDLTEILDRTTLVIRERIRIEGEIRTYTAQGRLTGWILGALPVVMLGLINVASPGYSHVLFYDPLGQKMLWGGAILILIGGSIIRKIVDIKV